MMQWKTMLSFPMKWTRRVSWSFHHGSQSCPLSAAHCFVALM